MDFVRGTDCVRLRERLKREVNMKRFVSLLLVVATFLSVLSLTGCDVDDVKKTADNVKSDAAKVWDDVKKSAGNAKSNAAKVIDNARDAIVKAYGSAKDGAVYVYNEAAELTTAGYQKASAKASELVGNWS